jgi:hypothetical protein
MEWEQNRGTSRNKKNKMKKAAKELASSVVKLPTAAAIMLRSVVTPFSAWFIVAARRSKLEDGR